MDQQPSVGRIVHWCRDGQCVAAIITDSGALDPVSGNVRLSVFDPHREAPRMVTCAPYSEDKRDYTWHWPERA
ncbi:MAG: hypothetical protein ACTHON_15100 [Humibacter sp.]